MHLRRLLIWTVLNFLSDWTSLIKVGRLTLMFALFLYIHSLKYILYYIFHKPVIENFTIIWTIFFIFSLISTPRITFRTCAIPMTSICSRSCICFESLLTNISKFIVCVNTSYLLVVGDLENSQYIIGGNIWKKKFKISGWLLISIHVREKSEMESGRVDWEGGGGRGVHKTVNLHSQTY